MNDETRMEQWKQRIEDCRVSGLTQRDWCSRQNLSYSSFRYWIRKIRNQDQEDLQSVDPVFARLPSELEVVEPICGDPPVVLKAAGLRFEIYQSCSGELLNRLIGAIGRHV